MDQSVTVGIISKPNIPHAAEIVCGLLEWLEQHQIRYRFDRQTAEYAKRTDFVSREEVPKGTNLVIVLGGDRTLLVAGRIVAILNEPMLPLNMGQLSSHPACPGPDLLSKLERSL